MQSKMTYLNVPGLKCMCNSKAAGQFALRFTIIPAVSFHQSCSAVFSSTMFSPCFDLRWNITNLWRFFFSDSPPWRCGIEGSTTLVERYTIYYTILMFFLWEIHRKSIENLWKIHGKPIDSLESRRLAEAGARIGKVPRPESDPKRLEKNINTVTYWRRHQYQWCTNIKLIHEICIYIYWHIYYIGIIYV